MKTKKLMLIASGAVASIVVLTASMWAAVPPLVQSLAESKGSEFIGRKIHIGSVDFNPLSLELTVKDIAVDTADGSAKQLSIGRAYLNLELQSLFRLAPVVRAVQVDAPTVLLTHLGGGRYDVDDVIERLNTPPDPSGPARFAVYNIAIQGGSVNFIDRDESSKTDRQHTIRDLTLSLPFVSNLDAYQTVEVQPHLAFKLNDVPFDANVKATPFTSTPQGGLSLQSTGLTLDPYLPYLPQSLPVKIKKAVLDTDVQVDFNQPPAPAKPFVSVRGKIKLADLQVQNPQGQDLLQLGALQVDMADVRPLERSVQLADVQITAPVVNVARNKAGALNWALPQVATPAKKKENTTDASPWTAELAHFSLKEGLVKWHDGTVQPSADIALQEIQINGENLHWPANASAKLDGSVFIVSKDKKSSSKPGKLAFDVQGTDQDALLKFKLQGLGLGLANPYLGNYLEPQLAGTLDAQVDGHWKNQRLHLAIHRLAMRDFALKAVTEPQNSTLPKAATQILPGFQLLEVKNAKVDVNEQSVQIASIQLKNPVAMLNRDAQGQWGFARWIKAGPATTSDKTAAPQKPWKLALNQFNLDNGNLKLEDRKASKTVRLEVSKLQTQLKNLNWDGQNLAPQAMPVSLSASVQAGRTDPGSIDYQGSVQVHPHLEAQGKFNVHELPLHAIYPYVGSQFNVDVLRADANLKGMFKFAALPAGPELTLTTDATLEDVRVKTIATQQQGSEDLGMGEELLRWKMLNVPGIELAMAPQKPTTIKIQQVLWSDFYARLVVDKSGRMNLQGLVKEAPAENENKEKPVATEQSATLDPIIYLGPVKLVNGKVDFTDQFIQPNYSADLTDLHGTLSQVSSVRSDGTLQMADLSLRGRAEGTAQLEIAGKLNPLVKPLVLNIRGKVQDLELPPLSTYSVKYAGYGIERGKLSVDVHYNIQPDGHLQAGNKIVLNQLTFGDKVPTSAANLPVKLAVALLQDRNGVIDINLPISGSIDDPEFRIGPIIFQVLGNIIKKAITAPFSLLASAFSGAVDADQNSNTVQFAAGSSTLTASTQQVLDKFAKTLVQKPGLTVTVSGTANETVEREAMQRAQLNKLLQNHKRRRANVSESNAKVDATLPAEEYATLLKEVYRRADIVKPRNVLGLAKELTTSEMEELMLANIRLSVDAARDLALERSLVVKEYLIAQKITKERLFLGAVKTEAQEGWSPGAEISLSMP